MDLLYKKSRLCPFSGWVPLTAENCLSGQSQVWCVSNSAITWTVAHQAPLFVGFPRQAHWRGLHFQPHWCLQYVRSLRDATRPLVEEPGLDLHRLSLQLWLGSRAGTEPRSLCAHTHNPNTQEKRTMQWGNTVFYICLGLHSFQSTFTSMTLFVVVVQSLSRDWLSVTLWTAAPQASLSFSAPEVCSNSCPLSQWCSPTISSSAIFFIKEQVLLFPFYAQESRGSEALDGNSKWAKRGLEHRNWIPASCSDISGRSFLSPWPLHAPWALTVGSWTPSLCHPSHTISCMKVGAVTVHRSIPGPRTWLPQRCSADPEPDTLGVHQSPFKMASRALNICLTLGSTAPWPRLYPPSPRWPQMHEALPPALALERPPFAFVYTSSCLPHFILLFA